MKVPKMPTGASVMAMETSIRKIPMVRPRRPTDLQKRGVRQQVCDLHRAVSPPAVLPVDGDQGIRPPQIVSQVGISATEAEGNRLPVGQRSGFDPRDEGPLSCATRRLWH